MPKARYRVNDRRQVDRNGIPRRGGDSPRCIWPRCPKPIGIYPDIPLCSAHATLVKDAVTLYDQQLETMRQANLEAQYGPLLDPMPPKVEQIYYVKVGGHIKIGYTTQLEQRMRQFPPNCELLAVEPGTHEDEQRLHKRFAAHRSHGREWYPLVPVLLEHIDRVVREHGEPDAVTFGAQPAKVPEPRPKQYLRPKGWSGKVNTAWK